MTENNNLIFSLMLKKEAMIRKKNAFHCVIKDVFHEFKFCIIDVEMCHFLKCDTWQIFSNYRAIFIMFILG